MRILLDPWQPELGPELPALATPAAEPEAQVDCDVEVAAAAWVPITPAAGLAPDRFYFVDGVRRAEARIVGVRENKRFLGCFGALAVGAVAAERGAIRFHTVVTERVVVTGGGERLPAPVVVSKVLVYTPLATPGEEPEAPVAALQARMRATEETLARGLRDAGDGIVICDGPMRSSLHGTSRVLGLIKRIANLYVPPSLLPVLGRLERGQRTPLLALKNPSYGRYTWFLRLAAPRRGDSETSGLVRVEVSDTDGVDAARALADQSCTFLPDFASVRGLHPRAPQNLLPIGALETRLRRELGDVGAIHRQIQTTLANEDT